MLLTISPQRRFAQGPLFLFLAVMFLVALTLFPVAARSGDFVLGLGADNIDASQGSTAGALQLEYHFDPFHSFSWGALSAFGVIMADTDEDYYAGVGVSTQFDLSEDWFIEGSLAAGYYESGPDGIDLGGDLQFRTLVGIARRIGPSRYVSLALDHLSNAGIEDVNPGRNGVFLRYATSF